ncbi:MAG: hypothetical protein LWX54_00020 [Deltaproteobacteria bacterium]|jgi:hypothetical protein|nr:hypothetical protein [Deltaproteobacteria bacterium]
MTRKAARKNEDINSDLGEIVLYQSEDGQAALDVHLQDETVWLTQAQMEKLFQRDQSVISRHVNNIFKEGELQRRGNMQKMHIANSDKPVAFYNLDIIISVGSFLFLLFLKKNDLLDQKSFSNKALVALALLTAASEPGQKELIIRLIVNLISEEG